jgi:hypothetical protein
MKMSKRFTDSEKFRDVWYRKLSPTHKCFWEYLLSECDSAGIIEIDFESASFHIGAEVTEKDLDIFSGRVIKLNDGKYFIPKFIEFQQGELNPQNNAHKPIIERLKGYGYTLEQPLKEFVRGFEGGSEEVRTSPSNSKGKGNGNGNGNINRAREEKLTFDNVIDWESLFDYWEQNKKGGKYKNAESRNRQLAKLKELTNDNFDYAKQAIVFCIDNKYQGFTDGSKLYYRNVSAAPASRKTADEDFYAQLNALGASND